MDIIATKPNGLTAFLSLFQTSIAIERTPSNLNKSCICSMGDNNK